VEWGVGSVVHGQWCRGGPVPVGARCGCCWALLAVLLVVGLMNLVWMAAITLVFMLEKNWRFGGRLHLAVGAALVALGFLLAIHPELPLRLSGTATMTMEMPR